MAMEDLAPSLKGAGLKSLMLFIEYVLKDLGTWCLVSTTRDYNTIASRFDHEGMSFLTISLANFGKDFERSLELGFADPTLFTGFSRRGGLPRFLGGFLDLVFDRGTGRLLDQPDVTAVWAIRQLTLMFAKVNLPCSDARWEAAIDGYVECDENVLNSDKRLTEDPTWVYRYRRLATVLWGPILAQVDNDIYYDRIVPTHGPGSTADRLEGNLKWMQTEWTERLEEVFPHWVHLSSSWMLSLEHLDHVDVLEPETERPVRVVTVPKTLKAPRVIAIEPTCMQYMQQGIKNSLVDAIEGDRLLSMLIGFSDQEPNRELALEGSLKGELATLDLSEASDRVSNLHVRELAAYFPNFLRGVEAVRSRKADVPGHGIITLAKYASMGSALTFPLEAMVFLTVIFMGIESKLNRQLTREDMLSFRGQVRVYGDDLIVPVDYVEHVCEALEASGFKVNSDKSFWRGKFRESCGRDYYAGEDVSIVRLRRTFPTKRAHASEILSTISTRNQLYSAGLWQASGYLDDMLGRLIPFPVVAETSPLQGRWSFLGYSVENSRLHPDLHTPLVKGVVESSRVPASRLESYGALLKVLSKRSDLPFADERHLERAGRPSAVDIKQRWSQPF